MRAPFFVRWLNSWIMEPLICQGERSSIIEWKHQRGLFWSILGIGLIPVGFFALFYADIAWQSVPHIGPIPADLNWNVVGWMLGWGAILMLSALAVMVGALALSSVITGFHRELIRRQKKLLDGKELEDFEHTFRREDLGHSTEFANQLRQLESRLSKAGH